MRKILFLVTESRSANGICTKAVMKACVDHGFEVHCVTNREYGEPAEYEDGGVYYHTVLPRLCYRLDNYIAASAVEGPVRKLLTIISGCMNKVKLLLTVGSWPLISPAYARRIYQTAVKICLQNEIDTVIPVYTQIDTLIAAERIKAQMPNVRYIPYFLDSFSGGYGPKVFSRQWTIKRGRAWEDKLLPRADRIIMMQSAKGHYETYCADTSYFERIAFLDLPLFKPMTFADEKKTPPKTDVINLLYVGSIPAHIRDPHYFMEMFRLMDDRRLRLTIIGNSTCAQYLQNMADADNRIRILPPVSHAAALGAMKAADILVNLGNNNTRMTPSKVFEYMSLGKPILSTAPIDNEPSLVYLAEYPCKFVIDETVDTVVNATQALDFVIRNRNILVDPATLAERFVQNTPDAFVRCICDEE